MLWKYRLWIIDAGLSNNCSFSDQPINNVIGLFACNLFILNLSICSSCFQVQSASLSITDRVLFPAERYIRRGGGKMKDLIAVHCCFHFDVVFPMTESGSCHRLYLPCLLPQDAVNEPEIIHHPRRAQQDYQDLIHFSFSSFNCSTTLSPCL